MTSPRLFIILSVLALSAMFCSLPGNLDAEPTPDLEAAVQATLTAIAAQSPTEAPVSSSTGSISGSLGYPSDVIPPLRVVAYRLGTEEYYYVQTRLEQSTYQIDNLPPGTYHVIAYVNDPQGQFMPGMAGGYTAAVPCGLLAECTDHSLLEVVVNAGAVTSNINPTDWYAPLGIFPPDPLAPVVATGSIQGTLIFPSSFIPAQRVVAFNLANGLYFFTDTRDGQSEFTIENVPTGTYHVVAYTLTTPYSAAGYSAAVLCGLSADCTNHTLLEVTVTAGAATTDVNPHDWYAPEGAFPRDPTRP
ncbi:MAG: hypothetical protein WHV44_09680 [Anaerolineales bacterium]